MLLARRSLLIAASLAAAPRPAWAQNLARGLFTHGVASGDPLADRVILWTRFVPSGAGAIAWEVAEDDAFARVVSRGHATPSLASDFCVKADAGGLAPGRRYFYRFLSASGPSVTGMTRTTPQGGAESLSLAVFSCANFGFGYFHAYGHAAARDDIDIALHTGDYIYEIERGAYPNPDEMVAGRVIDPANETVTLSDYYQRYATYHTDADLLELRRLKPMSVIWDDHEFANDAWREGAGAHNAHEGAYLDRVAAATKAYFDWTPTRRPDPRGYRLYRSFDWGDLARVLLLDTRFIGRDRQLDYRNLLIQRLAESGADGPAIAEEFRRTYLDDPNRSLLGAEQERWLAATLADSKARGQTWQVLTQQVVLGAQIFPEGTTRFLNDGASQGSRAWVSGNERIGALGFSWNQDAWHGYGAARARFIDACAQQANNALVLGGDSHNCWINNVPSANGERLAAIEFAGGAVASPGFERTLRNAQPGEREQHFMRGNPELAYCDIGRRGYGAIKLTRTACEAEWVAFDDIRSPDALAPSLTRLASEPSASAGPGRWSV